MRLGNREIVHQMSDRIEPFDIDKVGPASYDVTLGEGMKIFDPRMSDVFIDGSKPIHYIDLEKNEDGYYKIKPGDTALGTTMERFSIPKTLEAQVDGRSSIGRVFLIIHCTAGYIDPGFKGNITLEFFNPTNCNVYLKPGDSIGQILFAQVLGCTEGYGDRKGSKYQGQIGTTVSRLHKEV